ncbi:hypothetical protein IEQ_01010 [Bacillus cereus BAG6X1-2]|nr:hypothetical protein IEQ_01010 [Bacillus cereus BAG6X1-2]
MCLYSNTIWHHPICAPTPTPVICGAREGEPRSIPLNGHRKPANESNCQRAISQSLAIQGNDTSSTYELGLTHVINYRPSPHTTINDNYLMSRHSSTVHTSINLRIHLSDPHENTVRRIPKRCIYRGHTCTQIKKKPRGSNLIVAYLVVPSCNFLLLISLYSLP